MASMNVMMEKAVILRLKNVTAAKTVKTIAMKTIMTAVGIEY